MKKIRSFGEFVNEAGGFLSAVAPLIGDLEIQAQKRADELKADRARQEAASSASDSYANSYSSGVEQGSMLPATFNPAPGNDDFTLYMQHQQGIAGAKGLIEASLGTGKLASDTIKTKSGTKYANLIKNVPSDRPQVKTDIIKALDAGDQKTAAALFLNTWKEKWKTKGDEAKVNINKPQNAVAKEAINKYSSKWGVPFDFAITVANIESGFNPKVGNNSYKGLYALSSAGFNKYVSGGDIYNADDNANAGIQTLRNNIKEFKRYLGPTTLASLNLAPWAKNLA
jgi:soluble lytic murein transglycosylase-like protein